MFFSYMSPVLFTDCPYRVTQASTRTSLPTAVGAAASAQRPVAAGLRTVCDPGALVMGQRLLLHAAEIACSARMAALAPARAITLTAVVIHRHNRKAGRALVAGVAVHACAGQQLRRVGDVVG